MIRRITLSILSVFMLYTLTGCWNNVDLSNMSLLSAYGIDKTEDGKIMVSVQIIKTPSIKSSQPNSGGSGGGESKSFYLISNTADSVFGAFHGLLTKINSKRIFLGSAQVIVFGEGIAKYGIQDYMDFILRDHKAQYKTDVIVAKNSTAKEILKQEYELSKVPGEYIRDTLKNSKDSAFSKRIMLLDVAKGLVTEGRSLAIGTIEKTEEITTTEGLAVFQKDKMIGWLDKYETRGYMYITNRLKSSVVEVKDPENPDKTVCIELKDFKSKIKIKRGQNNMPEAHIKIKVQGNIGEQSNYTLQESEYVKSVTKSLNAQIKEEAQKTLEKCQKEYKSDIFGFGMYTFHKYPKYWGKSKNIWDEEIFPKLKINIDVNGSIVRSGMLIKSIRSK